MTNSYVRRIFSVMAASAPAFVGALYAQELPVLRYDPPSGFYHSAITPPDDYTANEYNASFQVYPFRVFSGNVEQMFQRTLLREWIDSRYQESNVAGPPEFRPGNVRDAQKVVTARFVENVAGTARQHLRLLIIQGNAASLVDSSANNLATWQRAVPALNAWSASLRVESAAPASTSATGERLAIDGQAIAGLYMGTKSKYVVNLNRPVGYGSQVPALHFYLFSTDGRVYRAYDQIAVPGGDVRRFDFDAAQRTDPVNSGRYTLVGNQIRIQMGGQPPETIVTGTPQDKRLTIQAILYIRQ